MGVFTNSICLPGHRQDQARQALTRWLASRGYELSDEPVLFDLDADSERSAFIVTNERWTVLCFSHYEEEQRLIHELQTLGLPLLYVWVYDSSAWGFDLFREHRFIGSWSSDPDDHVTFGDPPPGADDRPWADPNVICRELSLPERADEVARLMRSRAVFREDVCQAFCELLEVEAAMTSYDELECGAVAAEGWRSEQLLFVRRDLRRTSPRDLHQQRLTQRNPAAGQLETGTVDVPLAVLEQVRRERRRTQLEWRLLRPLAWLARRWRQLVESIGRLGRRGSVAERPSPTDSDVRPTYRVVGTELINDRHGCRITLPPGVAPAVMSCKPSAVFAFDFQGVLVTCTARRLGKLREVLRRPDGAEVEHDERYQVAGLRARDLLYRLPPGFRADVKGPSYLGLHVIETVHALYVFLYNHPSLPQPALRRAIREMVESFRLDASEPIDEH